jgi:hypothetical protein
MNGTMRQIFLNSLKDFRPARKILLDACFAYKPLIIHIYTLWHLHVSDGKVV